nr:MAG TPA: major capsid protein [Caudoviricetes sp.]
MAETYDCSGWATKANMLCSDGRTIRKNAFEECDGKTVPVIWNHEHNDPNAVLGHAVLENRDNGVYAYISFNNTEAGQNAKILVQHKDVDRLSIWANKLKQMGGDVIHGVIREVSLVLAAANPGAVIDSVIAHGDSTDEEAIIYCGEYIEFIDELAHSDGGTKGETEVGTDNKEQKPAAKKNDKKTVADAFNTLTEEQKTVVYAMIVQALEDAGAGTDNKDKGEVKHADSDETIADVFNTLTDKQKTVVYAMIGQALEDAGVDTDDVEHSDEGETDFMKLNVFDKETKTQDQEILTHSEFQEIIGEARRRGSLKDAFLEHGITDVDTLFPDAQTIDKTPGFIQRDNGWVAGVMAAVHKTPFSRVKSIFADITEDEARAKGYIKGKQKKDEVFKMLKRVTTPVTVYKKQSLDRDDMLDITDFDMIPWLKQEMRMMLDEELARAYLFGDGRSTSAEDKINEQNIRPVWTDDDVYTVKSEIAITKATTAEEKAQAFIKACIKSRKAYKGSGNPTMYMSEDMLTDCLLLEDKTGRVIYDTVEKLATRLRVNKIVPVPVMEGLSRIKGANTHFLAGLYVNLTDYNVGTDRGGDVTMFDDFDIDFNKQKYLIETRCSGAMCKPYGAVAIEFVQATTDIAA